MKKSVLLLTFITILVLSYTSASAQSATTSSLALRLAQDVATPSGSAMLTSGGIVATAAAKVHVSVLPAFAQPANNAAAIAAPFSVEAEFATEVSMADELNTFISQERSQMKRSWFRKNK